MIDQTAAAIRGPLSSVITPCSISESNHSQNLLIYFSHFSSIFLCPLFLFLPIQSFSNSHLSQEELYSANGTAFLLLTNRDLFQASSNFSAPVIPRDPVLSQQVCLQSICSQIIWHFFLAFAGLFFIELSVLVAKNLYTLNTGAELAVNLYTVSRCTELTASASSMHLL